MDIELNEWLASLNSADEVSTDSTSVDHYQLLEKQKIRNKELRQHLNTVRDFGQEILGLYKSERQERARIQEKLNAVQHEFNDLQRSYDDLERQHVNETLNYNQMVSQLRENHDEEHKNYIELSLDYFELMSEATCFLNYELKKPQNKIMMKSERFLRNALGDNFQDLPKILRTKRARDDVSVVTASSLRSSKRTAGKTKGTRANKRMKTEIWDMNSVSQASSPATTIPFDEETSDLCSDISFNTFSIGNETSFTLLDKNSPIPSHSKCKCHLFAESDTVLVSTGTNTDPPEEPPVSVARLLSIDEDIEVNLTGTPITDKGENQEFPKRLCDDYMVKFVLDQDEAITGDDALDVSSSSDDCTNGERTGSYKGRLSFNSISNILDSPLTAELSTFPAFASIGTNTEPELIKPAKATVEQGTSPEPTLTCSKSTATVHSTTTRGTSTIKVAMKNCGVQFPEISFEKIFSETIFELPDCIDPIQDFELKDPEPRTSTIGTITELRNVNREIEYATPLRMIKTEQSAGKPVNAHDPEEQSFIILGQTLFDLFLKRIRQSNDCLSDDEITRQKIWKHLKRQLLDRFSELTFDETLNVSFTDLEIYDKITDNVFSDERPVENCKNVSTDWHDEEMDSPEVNDLVSYVTDDEPCKTSANDNFVKPAVPAKPVNVEQQLSLPEKQVHEIETNPFEEESLIYEEFEEILNSMRSAFSSPPQCIDPIDDLSDVIFSSLFPEPPEEPMEGGDFCTSPNDVLDGFDVEHDPIEIPTEAEPVFTEFESPRSPPPFVMPSEIDDPPEIPSEDISNAKPRLNTVGSVIDFDPNIRASLVQWQQRHKLTSKKSDKLLCTARKSITAYINAEWTDEHLDTCVKSLSVKEDFVLLEAIFETVEDNKSQDEINTDFTPGAPPLPHYQQKLILLIKKLADEKPSLPHKLVDSLEEKIFRFDKSGAELGELRNISYYYTSLVDLFFDGDHTMVFYFIVKCIYFYGYKAIPMVFVLIKAFPNALPKKSQLLKKYSKNIDWENMTGLELSKVHLDLDCMDSLDLTVMYVLTCIQQYRARHESKVIKDHELFNYLPKYYGFPLSFLACQKLLEILLKRLEDGRLENLSLSLILLAKRTNIVFSVKTMLRDNLLPLLNKYVAAMTSSSPQDQVDRICLLVETISASLKSLSEEKDKSFREVFPTIIGIIGRVTNQQIKESCIKALLRLQRFTDNHREIFDIVCQHYQAFGAQMSDGLRYAVITFIHRKKPEFFEKL